MLQLLPTDPNRNPLEEAMQTTVPNTPAPSTPVRAPSGLRTVAFSLLVDRALSA
jgi:hypothetical protein